ncbi:hydroxypyruvate isomerase family protein [Methylomonas sp. MED-D]|uniref:hydroxypyruvate isomerase family protein n=1 Tax=Methylomonas sp. MED-D TaxID=3418768 RepID=UPI00143A0256|nr:TIM barrel protein [Methylococcaceae bacterium WWC4]
MLRFSANLSLLFDEYPLLERFQAARRAGFDAVEIQFPYDLPAEAITDQLQYHDLRLVLFNVDAATLLQGGEGLAAVPERVAEFRRAVAQAYRYAQVLRPAFVNVLPGRCLTAECRPAYWQTLLDNLRFASDQFAELGVETVFEAINTFDMPGFLVDSGRQMLDILDQIGHPHLKMQYDIYHMTRMGEDCAAFIAAHAERIGHIQFADVPGRGEPGSGAVDFSAMFGAIADSAYRGWLGAEYRPSGATADSLAWLPASTV